MPKFEHMTTDKDFNDKKQINKGSGLELQYMYSRFFGVNTWGPIILHNTRGSSVFNIFIKLILIKIH